MPDTHALVSAPPSAHPPAAERACTLSPATQRALGSQRKACHAPLTSYALQMSPEPQPYFPLIAPLFPLHRRHLGRHSPRPGATQKRRRPSQLLPTSRLFSTPSVARSAGSLCTWLLFAVRVEALCTPSNKSELKFMVNVCLRESPDGNCTNFAAIFYLIS